MTLFTKEEREGSTKFVLLCKRFESYFTWEWVQLSLLWCNAIISWSFI